MSIPRIFKTNKKKHKRCIISKKPILSAFMNSTEIEYIRFHRRNTHDGPLDASERAMRRNNKMIYAEYHEFFMCAYRCRGGVNTSKSTFLSCLES